jgi:hypothetical protein
MIKAHDFKVVGTLNIDAKLVWLLNNENIDILCALYFFKTYLIFSPEA